MPIWKTWRQQRGQSFVHKLLTDDNLQHGFCLSDTDSRCKFKNSATSGVAYGHKHSSPADVMDVTEPVFTDLVSEDLLKSCLRGGAQNPNKSLNSVIWTRLPETVSVRLDTLKSGVHDAVLCFNDGVWKKDDVLYILGVRFDPSTANTLGAGVFQSA
jgi:hypothetical protein